MIESSEVWKDVVGFEGVYQVSSHGRIRTLPGKWRESLIRKASQLPTGYWMILLINVRKKANWYVHRLVAKAFLPNPHGLCCVDHLDANKSNNRVENLEWVDRKENVRRAKAMGLMKILRGEQTGSSKLTEEKVREIRRLYASGVGATQLAKDFGIKRRCVYNVVDRDTWAHVA